MLALFQCNLAHDMEDKIVVLLFILSGFSVVYPQSVTYRDVKINQGVVRGYKQPGENIFTFQSIPYAAAPTGRDFYKAPLPAPTWNGTFEATDKKIACYQDRIGILPKDTKFEEQCLIANIYIPDNITEKLPVLVLVHGGAFLIGYGNSLQTKNLVNTGKVIAVTFNYRLGPHGFLCLGTDAAPGNAGVKDQVALLRWVRDNIEQFGGNPNDVTIAGCSAGSSSIDLLLISKMAKGLFHKVIAGSGANTNAFSVQTEPLENAKQFAQLLGFNNTNDVKALENFYLDTPFETLLSYTSYLHERLDSVVLFSPCIEKDIGQEIFLHDSPVKILESKDYVQVPMLYGFCNMEGLFRLHSFDNWKTLMNENFIDFLPPDLGNSLTERETLAKEIKRFYFGDEQVSENNILRYIDFFTDIMFGYAMLRSAKLQVEAGNNQLYLYEYSFADESVDLIPNTNVRGATHCDQEAAVMDMPNENELSPEYQNMKKVMRDLWLNFVTTGLPVPHGSNYPAWPPMSLQRSYMSLNNTLEYKESLMPERAKFWDDLVKEHYKFPSPPNPTNFGVRFQSTIYILNAALLFIFISY
uniref:Carboxylic ester hydrolase n=1 Tax=Pieris rapae TaxID=64459 RepID=A0A1U9X1W0_PIERA|nr:carboxylesterase [Pieris rapae]